MSAPKGSDEFAAAKFQGCPACDTDRGPDRCCTHEPDCIKESSAAITYRCAQCGEPVTVPHAAAWPKECPHCKTAPPTLLVKVPNG